MQYKTSYKVFIIGIILFIHSFSFAQNRNNKDSIKNTNIDVVHLKGFTPTKKAQTQATRAIVIDTKSIAEQAVSLSEIMNQSPGIRIRQSGGLGSRPDISINGFTGKSVKYFKDGIPLDYLGEGYNIGNIPMETLERVEVYKGVLPIELGADALGGAVNFVTKNPNAKNINVYYQSGSFDTYRAGINGSLKTKDDKYLFGTNIFLNFSKNNYKAIVNVADPITKTQHPENLTLFHNAYRNLYGEIFFAFKNRTWADELKFSLTGFFWDREQQHPSLMTDPYGGVLAKQKTIAPSVYYKKIFADAKLTFQQFLSYNRLQTQRTDSLNRIYDWYGNFTLKQTRGESGLASNSHINEDQILSRTNLQYKLNEATHLDFNYVFTNIKRFGTDPYGQKLNGNGIDLLSIPSHYQKHIVGLGLSNYFLDRKLQNTLVGKYYFFNGEGVDNLWRAITIVSAETAKQKGGYWGVADAIKFNINRNNLIRVSGEYACRLPEREELFGNSVFIVSNFKLRPERSLNLNLGYRWDFSDKFMIDINSFYRRTQDLILLVPIQVPNAQYNNVRNVKGYGFDIDTSLKITKNYSLNGNATWQNLRLFGFTDPIDLWQNGTRLRNTPYFFSNLSLKAQYNDVFGLGDSLSLYTHYNFLREFYLVSIRKELEPSGFLGLWGKANINTQLLIPNQHILNLGAVYHFSDKHYTAALEVRNIFNNKVFDYYRVQRPGRNYSIKISYNF